MKTIDDRIQELADGDSNDAEIDGLTSMVRDLAAVLEQVADGPCRIYPTPGPERDAEDRLVWAANCLDDLERGPRRPPCDRCRAKRVLGLG